MKDVKWADMGAKGEKGAAMVSRGNAARCAEILPALNFTGGESECTSVGSAVEGMHLIFWSDECGLGMCQSRRGEWCYLVMVHFLVLFSLSTARGRT